MSTFRDILDRALALDEHERVALLDALRASLDPTRDELGPGWAEEIARRIAAIERDEVKLIPGHEVSRRVRAALEKG